MPFDTHNGIVMTEKYTHLWIEVDARAFFDVFIPSAFKSTSSRIRVDSQSVLFGPLPLPSIDASIRMIILFWHPGPLSKDCVREQPHCTVLQTSDAASTFFENLVRLHYRQQQ